MVRRVFVVYLSDVFYFVESFRVKDLSVDSDSPYEVKVRFKDSGKPEHLFYKVWLLQLKDDVGYIHDYINGDTIDFRLTDRVGPSTASHHTTDCIISPYLMVVLVRDLHNNIYIT